MMKSVLLFCLLAGLEVVYCENNDVKVETVYHETKTITYNNNGQQQTITFDTMTIPPQSFVVPSSQGEERKLVRDRSSPQLPMISFNNGDIKHIIEEMHLAPKPQRMDGGKDSGMQVILFSIDPSDEDLGKAMKKNSHVETRLPLMFQQIPTQRASSKKVIPQAPAQRKELLQSPSQQEPTSSKPSVSTNKLIREEPLFDVQKQFDKDWEKLTSGGMFSNMFDDFFSSFNDPFSSKSRSDDSNAAKAIDSKPANTNPTPAISHKSSDALPKFTTQSAVSTPSKNIIDLDNMPLEFMQFIEAMHDNDRLPQSMFFRPFF